MTTATAPAVEKRKKPWTKARVIDLIIDIFCFVIVGAASLTCILPFIHILAKSLSDNAYVVANRVILLPMSDAGINLDAYNKVFHDPTIMQSLWVTALVTVVFTAIGMFLTVCASYALTRPEFHGRKVFTFMIMFTMYFTAGTIPDYLLMNQLHMLDTIWCLILPLCFAPYNLLIMKNNFQGSIPESLIESARLDGASHFTILAKIVVPLSKPIMATIALFYAVGRWNAYSDALYNDLYSDIVGHETYAGTIQCAAQNDLIPPEWVADGSLYPNQTVTAADFLAVLIPGAAGRRPLADAVPVPDSVPVYAKRAVGQAVAEGLIAPEALTKPLNRSNAAEICRRLHI